MSEPDIFYILGNKVRRDLLSHLTCTECYFSLLSSKVNVSSTAVSRHLKIMERERVLKSYEKEEGFIGPTRKYYSIAVSKTFLVTITPNIFWYKGLDLDEPEKLEKLEIKLNELEKFPQDLHSMIKAFINANKKLEQVIEALKNIESYRNNLMKNLKDKYLKEVGDMTQLAILHYLLLYDTATVEDLSDVLNLKEREVREKVEELSKVVPIIIKKNIIKIDKEAL
ncbi:sulfur metabolism transcriptional regulator SurR [Thermococcus sibiricus]|uniref:Predicted transcription regulator, ArsR family n=1 Tax=Thermococcus sibiricus (strain DSM 12597 / MM 739) TaxID=604354 RepID=C6A353_THESM|nr:ArsR family transcriptional regulator [Thermococcus sibiricus]ACS90048.1 Predicted transcription regulator, ArsR family [Thermococcus sibiricus MM 739]